MAEELDNELENQDISTEEFDDDVESDPEEDRLYSMSDEELEKEFIKAKSEARQQVKKEPNKDIAEGDVDDDADNDDKAEPDETGENSESDEADESEDVGSKTEPKNEKFKIKANGVEIELSQDDLVKLAPKAIDYTRKMQQIAPFRKSISAMEENGITEQDINMLIEMKKGNKDAIAAMVKEAKVDPLDIDIEDAKPYTPPQYGMNETQIRIRDVVSRIQGDAEYKMTEDVVDRQWDSQSRKTLAENPDMIEGLHIDIKSGIFAKVAPEMMRLKILDGSRKSDLDYYLQAGQMMSEQFKKEQETIAKEANRKSQQKEIEDAANKRKSASLPRSTSGKKKVIDYLDEEDDESYKKWYKKTMAQS